MDNQPRGRDLNPGHADYNIVEHYDCWQMCCRVQLYPIYNNSGSLIYNLCRPIAVLLLTWDGKELDG